MATHYSRVPPRDLIKTLCHDDVAAWRTRGDGPEAVIRARIACATSELEAVRANAEAARIAIESLRGVVDKRYLIAGVDYAERVKVVALEAYLVDLDALLEYSQTELGDIRIYTAGSADELCAASDRLSRIDGVFARVLASPPVPVDPSTIACLERRGDASASFAYYVLAPRGAAAADLDPIQRAERTTVCPGGCVRIPLRLSASFLEELRETGGSGGFCGAPPPLEAALGVVLPRLAAGVRVRALLRGPGADDIPLQGVSVFHETTAQQVAIAVTVPASATVTWEGRAGGSLRTYGFVACPLCRMACLT